MKWKTLLLAIYLCKELLCQHLALYGSVIVREGEIAILTYPQDISSLVCGKNSSLGLQELIEEVGRPLVKHKNMLIIMKALKNDTGMYTCMEKHGEVNGQQTWINLTMYSECYVDEIIYDGYSYEKNSYDLTSKFTRNLSSLCELNTTWYKVSDNCHEEYISSESDHHYFELVSKRDEGVYKSKHFCEYKGQLYYTSDIHYLTVEDYLVPLQPKIIKPTPNAVIFVDLGQKAEVMCLVVLNQKPDFMSLHWINESSYISDDPNMSIYYNHTILEQKEQHNGHMIAWLVVKNVTKDHLNTAFTCKLESTLPVLINVSITFKQKVTSESMQAVSLAIVAVFAFIVVVVTIVYYKLKIYIVLFFRDLQHNPCPPKDGKQYDAYISYYKTCSDEAFSADERALLLDALETRYGYRLCVYDRDMLPGEAAVEAVLEHVKRSRRLLLIPRAEGPEAEDQYGLLGGLHTALVDRHTRLILIRKTPCGGLNSLPESLHLLARSGGAVTWKGDRSAPLSSEFWKHMLYHMPARRRQQNELGLL